MTALEDRLAEYLHVRRQLGFKLKSDGYLLADFVAFLDMAGAERITNDLSVMWARRPGASARYHMERLSMVRGFARYLATIDPANEIPPVDLLRARENRKTPYLYSEREVDELIAAAAALTPAQRGATYRTVIGVMATSGLRIGETLALDHGDVDLKQGVLHIRDGKGRRHRDVPMHHTTTQVLRDYARLRDRACPRPDTPAFFISMIGTRITASRFHKTFRKLIAQVDPQPGRERAHRRPHDLRHTFAVRTLLGWHHAGVDIDRAMPLLSTYLGHSNPSSSYWYLQASPELMQLVANRLDNALGGTVMTLLAPTLQAWFTDRLMTQKNASPRTIAAYRDTLRLLLIFAQEQIGKEPCQLDFADLDAPVIGAFLNHLEQDRGNSSKTRNARLAAIQTGVRVSELVNLTITNLTLGTGAHLRVLGKGRKERSAVLTRETVTVLEPWLRERKGEPHEPLFPTRRGGPLTPRAFALLLDKHTAIAAQACPSLQTKRVTPHTLRHTNAMLLRAENVDIFTIALWLGHESTKSTEIYLHADDKLKQQAIDRTAPTGTPPGRYQPPDQLLAFLERL